RQSVYLWQISKQIFGILLTMVSIELLQIELTPILIIFSWFFFLVPPLPKKYEWHWRLILGQYGALLFLPVIGLISATPVAIVIWAVIVLVLPYLCRQGVSLMMIIAVFLVGIEYILLTGTSLLSYLLPLLVTSVIAYSGSRLLLPLGNGWFIDQRIYRQTQQIFVFTKRNCEAKQLITPKEFTTYASEYHLLKQTIESYQTWGTDFRARYRKHVVLYKTANELNMRALDVLKQVNEADAPQWVREEFHKAQTVHQLLLETLYQDLTSCPILAYQMPKTVYDQKLSHSLAIYTLANYLTELEAAVVLWQEELCHAKN
ncbi:MAG: hypothetical protein ACRC3A_01590, partial [Culicoidibacterales bacterium]